MIFPDFSLTFPVCSKFPDFSLTGKCLPIFPGFPGFPVRVGTLSNFTDPGPTGHLVSGHRHKQESIPVGCVLPVLYCTGGVPLDRDPSVNRITDRCKNISFPQLRLRAVKISLKSSNRTIIHSVAPPAPPGFWTV